MSAAASVPESWTEPGAPHGRAPIRGCARRRLRAGKHTSVRVSVLLVFLGVPGAPPARADDPAGAYQVYRYDSLGNLIGAWDSAGRNARFQYDAADNRTQAQTTAEAPPPRPSLPPEARAPETVYRVIKTPAGTVIIPASIQ